MPKKPLIQSIKRRHLYQLAQDYLSKATISSFLTLMKPTSIYINGRTSNICNCRVTAIQIATTLHTLFPFNSMPENNGMRALQEHSHRQSSIHSTSIASSIRLRFTAAKGSVIPITGITINPRISFHVSLIRLLIELFLILFIVF